jgi:hypothetical protein
MKGLLLKGWVLQNQRSVTMMHCLVLARHF